MSQKIINNILTDEWFKARVIKGKNRGKKLGFPTVNLKPFRPLDFKFGVYLSQIKIEDQIYQGLFHYGPRPTFKEKKPVLEIYILDFNQDLKLETKSQFKLLKYLRETKKFKNKEQLSKQISNDIIKTKQYFKKFKKEKYG